MKPKPRTSLMRVTGDFEPIELSQPGFVTVLKLIRHAALGRTIGLASSLLPRAA